jgi:hypothetical protein
MSSNIFSTLGDVTSNLAQKELQELKQLQQNEETLASIKISSDLEVEANRYLLDKATNYNYDGRLAADADQYMANQESAVLNSITNKGVKARVAANSTKLKADFRIKADTLQVGKHLEKQKTDWNSIKAQDSSEIILSGGDFDVLDLKIEKWNLAKDGFSSSIAEKALPETIGTLTKSAMETQMSNLQVRYNAGEMDPEDAGAQLDVIQQRIFKNTKAYGLTAEDVRVYGIKMGNMREALATGGKLQYKAAVSNRKVAAEKLIATGQMSPLNGDYIADIQALKKYATPEEDIQIELDYENIVRAYEIGKLSSSGKVDELAQMEKDYKAEYETAKASGADPRVQLAKFTTYSIAKAKHVETAKLVRTDVGKLVANNLEIKQIIATQGGNAGFNAIAAIAAPYSSVAQFRPMLPEQIAQAEFLMSTAGENHGEWRQRAQQIEQNYAGFVPAMGKDGVEIYYDQMMYHFAQKQRSSKEGEDPFTLDDKKVMLARFHADPQSSFMLNYLGIANKNKVDTGVTLLGKDIKKSIQEGVGKEIRHYISARNSRGDLVSTAIPELVLAPLITDVALGHYQATEPGNFRTSVNYAVDHLVKKYVDIQSGVHGNQAIVKETPKAVKNVLMSRERTTSAVMSLMKTRTPDLRFSELYSIENNLDQKVTKAVLANKSELQQIGDGQYGLYLRFQTNSMQVLDKVTKKPIVFRESEITPFGDASAILSEITR